MRLLLAILPITAFAAAEDGRALFEKHCQSCHQPGSVTRAPLPEVMKSKPAVAILAVLETGAMKAQAAELTAAERTLLANYLGSPDGAKLNTTGFCEPDFPSRTDSTFWNAWGVDRRNTRFQPKDQAKLTASDFPNLKLKWAFGFPQSATVYSQPTLVGGRLYFGSENGTVYALNARTGCIYWTFKATATVRTAITIAGTTHNRYVAYFADTQANVYAIDAATSRLLWKTKVEEHRFARVTGAPQLYEDRLFVPVSSTEEVSPGNGRYECCTFRGSVVALDLEKGTVIWKTYTIPDAPAPTGKNSAGAQLYGPSGAAIWSSPTLDLKRKLLYVGTGNGYSEPTTGYSDAVQAFDMHTGKRLWVRQFSKGDNWNFGCSSPMRANCPGVSGPDFDIGAAPILVGDLLIIGQKSGIVRALNPDAEGAVIWETRVGKGGMLGGIQWGMAAGPNHVYVALSDRMPGKPELEGGLFALQLATGTRTWNTPAPLPDCKELTNCSAAQMSPVTALDGVVLSGSMDGHLRAYNAATGAIIWDYPTRHEFETVNGVKAKGGSIGGASGPVVAGGMLFVNSGYGALSGIPGNVLLAFGL